MRASISNQDVQHLEHEELLNRLEEMLAVYDSPSGPELHSDRHKRLSRTIDEIPEIYRWLIHLFSWADHWTDAMKEMNGQSDRRYKALRQRRDLLDKMASSAKMRYESASRQITLISAFDENGMPRSRRVD